MANTSVKITANSSDYQSQMKQVTEQMKTLSSEYSAAAASAKLFGSRSDELKAKVQMLTDKIKSQETVVKLNREQQERLTEKLSKQKSEQEELKKKIDAAKEAYQKSADETGKNSEQSKKLNEELKKLEKEYSTNESAIGKSNTALEKQKQKTNYAEAALSDMEKELKDVNKELEGHKLNEFADAAEKAGDKMESFGKKASWISAGVTAVGVASIASFNELDEGYDTIVTKTGATGDALDGLTQSANNVFGNMPTEMSTVGEAIGEVNTRFHSTGEELETLSTQFIQFAEINGTDVTGSVDNVDKIMKAWNVDSSDTGNLLGLLTAKAQETGISVDKLEGYVLDNNATFKEMGLSLEQSINLMAQLDENGVDTSTALAGLKKALKNATDGGMSLEDALKNTIGSIRDAKTDTEALKTAQELFGTKGAAEMAKAIQENRFDLEDLSTSMEGYGTVVEDTYNATLDPIDQSKVAMNNAKLAMSDLASTAQTAAAPVIEEATGKIKELTQKFMGLDDSQKETIIKVGLVAAAVGPLAVGFGKTAKGISETVKFAKNFVSGAAGLIGKITAKTAATAAGTAADAAGAVAEGAHTAATAAAATTTGGMTAAQTALNAVMALCPIILIVALIAGLIAAGVALYKNWDTVKEKLQEFWNAIKEKFEAIKEAITGAFSKAKEAVSGKVKEIGDSIKNSKIGQVTTKVFTGVKDTVTKMAGKALENTKANLGKMKDAYEKNGGGIKGVVAAGMEGVKTAYKNGFNLVDKLTGGKLSEITGKFSNGMAEAKAKVTDKLNEIKDGFKQKLESARDTVKSVIEKIKGFFKFSWSLPKLKMPHPKISGEFSLNPPSVPKFSIDWYKTGAIMNQSMIFGMNGSTLLAGGEPETGGEAILPLAPFYSRLESILDKKLEAIQQITNVHVEAHTYLDGDEIASRTVTRVDEELVRNSRSRR